MSKTSVPMVQWLSSANGLVGTAFASWYLSNPMRKYPLHLSKIILETNETSVHKILQALSKQKNTQG